MIEVKPIPPDGWARAIARLSAKASFVSKLLLGEIPTNVEEELSKLNLHLLPASRADFKTSCSCPDYSNPCKHVAGLCYRVASELDSDPFLLFQLRGISKEDLQAELRKTPLDEILSSELNQSDLSPVKSESYYARPETVSSEIPIDLKHFWSGAKRLPQTIELPAQNALPAILIKKQETSPFLEQRSFLHRNNGRFLRSRPNQKPRCDLRVLERQIVFTMRLTPKIKLFWIATGIFVGIATTLFTANAIHLIRANANEPLKPSFTATTAQDFYDQGLRQVKNKDFEAAIQSFTEAIRRKPNFAEAYYQRALASYQPDERGEYEGKYEQAIADLTQVIKLQPKNSEAYYQRGYIQMNSGGNTQAVKRDFDQAIRLNPRNTEAYDQRAELRQNDLNDKRGAIADYTQILHIKPNDAFAYLNRAEAKADLGDKQGAIHDEMMAVQVAPTDSSIYAARAYYREKRGDLKGAETDYTQAIRLSPEDADLYFQRALIRQSLKDFQGAVADFTEIRRIKTAHLDNVSPDVAETYTRQAEIRASAKDYQGAIADYTQAIQIRPTDDLYVNRARYRFQIGDKQGAIADYTQAIQLKPCESSNYSVRASLRSDVGDKQGAIADLTEAIRYQDIERLISRDYFNRGKLRFELKDYQKAIADYTAAIKLEPKFVQAYSERSKARAALGDQKARSQIDKKLQIYLHLPKKKASPTFHSQSDVL